MKRPAARAKAGKAIDDMQTATATKAMKTVAKKGQSGPRKAMKAMKKGKPKATKPTKATKEKPQDAKTMPWVRGVHYSEGHRRLRLYEVNCIREDGSEIEAMILSHNNTLSDLVAAAEDGGCERREWKALAIAVVVRREDKVGGDVAEPSVPGTPERMQGGLVAR